MNSSYFKCHSVLLLSLFCASLSSFAAGVVTNADEPSLRTALAGGGTVTFACDGIIGLSSTLVITNDTFFDATSHAITISGNKSVRIIQVNSGIQFTALNLTVANGQSDQGAGLYNDGGNITISDCSFTANQALGANGASNSSPSPGGAANGGAIYNTGSLALIGCSFTTNNATGGTGGSYSAGGPASGDGAAGGDAAGGAIFSTGNLSITNCIFSYDQANGGAGGSAGSGGGAPGRGANAYGGAIFNQGGSVNDLNCVFIQNRAVGGICPGSRSPSYYRGLAEGGAICNISGTTSLTGGSLGFNSILGSPASGGAIFHGGGTLTCSSLTIISNAAAGDASTVYYASTGATGSGGGLFNGAATLTIMDCTISSNNVSGGTGVTLNTASGAGGGGNGAGICNAGVLDLIRCTLAGNTATGGQGGRGFPSGPGGAAAGGGLYNSGNQAHLVNCTLAGNRAIGVPGIDLNGAGGNGLGGGINNNAGAISLTNCTLLANQAIGGTAGPPSGSAGIGSGGNIFRAAGGIKLLNTILAGGMSANVSGSLTDLGHNISSDSSCAFSAPGSLNNTDSKLGVFGNYGGPTFTIPLLAGSPAIDAADNGGAPATDQRGQARPYGSTSDIGAFELAQVIFSQPQNQTVLAQATATFSTVVQGNDNWNFQWLFDGVSLAGATSSTLVITNVVPSQAGYYTVTVSNALAAATSSNSMLTVLPFIINPQPQSQTVLAGASASMSVGLQGSGPFSYQWQLNGSNLGGATDNPLNLPNVPPGQAGIYSVVVSNAFGTIASSNATLTVLPFAITNQPQSQTGFVATTVSFSVGVQASDPKSFQWRFNGLNLAGATSSQLALPNISTSQTGAYSVVVSNAYGFATSSNAILTVLVTPGQALDEPGLPWQVGGNLGWFAETNITHDGVLALQSGPILDNQQSTVSTTVIGPGTLTFWWKVSSEDGADFLRFFIGPTAMAKISGEVDWQQKSFAIPAGPQILQWSYKKDVDVSSGLDAGWLDQVRFVNNRLDSLLWLPNGSFQFRNGMPSGTYVIYASTNLTDWSPISTNTIASGAIVPVFQDPASINIHIRFYRAQQQ